MNVSLILYAEHEFNASTFTARVCASTLSDLYSCVTAAIGSLREPLVAPVPTGRDGNDQAFGLWFAEHIGVARREIKIMGFGHAIYKESDPRSRVIKGWAKKLYAGRRWAAIMPVSKPSTRP